MPAVKRPSSLLCVLSRTRITMTLVEQSLEALTDDSFFETVCHGILTNAGYDVDPRGGSGDAGRDAIESSKDTGEAETVFQYSIEQKTKNKLKNELKRYKTG